MQYRQHVTNKSWLSGFLSSITKTKSKRRRGLVLEMKFCGVVHWSHGLRKILRIPANLSALTNHNKQYFKPNLLFVPAYRRGGHCSISRTLQKNSRGLAPPRGLQTHESIFTCRTLLTWVMPSCPGSGPLFTCRTQLLDSSPSCLAVSRMTLSTSLFT